MSCELKNEEECEEFGVPGVITPLPIIISSHSVRIIFYYTLFYLALSLRYFSQKARFTKYGSIGKGVLLSKSAVHVTTLYGGHTRR